MTYCVQVCRNTKQIQIQMFYFKSPKNFKQNYKCFFKGTSKRHLSFNGIIDLFVFLMLMVCFMMIRLEVRLYCTFHLMPYFVRGCASASYF